MLESDQLFRLLTKARLRLLLRALNQEIESEKSEDVQLPDELTIEHLLPQNWLEHWPLPDMEEAAKTRATQRRDHLKHTLGNLTLLTKKLNPSISNSGWSTKRPEITKQSKLNLNREFHDVPVWEETPIEHPWKALRRDRYDIWPRPGGEFPPKSIWRRWQRHYHRPNQLWRSSEMRSSQMRTVDSNGGVGNTRTAIFNR